MSSGKQNILLDDIVDISHTYYDSQEKRLKNMDEKEFNYRLLEAEIKHVKELSEQHDKLSNSAIQKAEESLTDQLEKVSINIEALAKRFEENIKSVTERNKESEKTINEKVDTLKIHFDEKLDLMRGGLEERLSTNLRIEIEKFVASDKQMNVLINANADKSNEGILDLKAWRDKKEGSLTVITWILGVVTAIVIALVIAFLTKYL